MQSLDQHLRDLVKRGKITADVAMRWAADKMIFAHDGQRQPVAAVSAAAVTAALQDPWTAWTGSEEAKRVRA
jgi:hypothetical protein